MAFKRISGTERRKIQIIVDRCWEAGLEEATFSQVSKDPAGWTRKARQVEAAREAEETAREAEKAAREAEEAARQVDVVSIIAQLRSAGRSAREIAHLVGVHVSTVYRWARGAFKPQAQRLAVLASI